MIVQNHDQAVALLDRYVIEQDNAILVPTIKSLMDYNAESVLAIQRGSGNEMSTLSTYLFLVGRAGLISDNEAMDYITAAFPEESRPRQASYG